jgi:type IV pilus assembly protein PilM
MSSSFSRKLFTDHIPPPKFLEMPTIGLDISDEMVRFAELKRKGGRYELGKFGQRAIPADVIEAGYIKDKETLIKILVEIRKEENLHFVVASLPEDKSYLFKTELPLIPEKDIRGALQFKIEENVPIALTDAVFDFAITSTPKPGVTTMEVTVTVLHTKVVTSYLEVLHGAGLVPLRLLTESQAIARVVVPPGDIDTYIIAALRETKTTLLIVSNGAIHYTSTVPMGSDQIAEALKKEFSIDDAEVEKIRVGKVIKDKNELLISLANNAALVRDEIQKLIAYWEGHASGKRINHIVLSGSDTLLGLDAYLSRTFTLPIVIADAWKNITSLNDYLPPLTHRESLDYIPALGLAMPQEQND